MSRAHSARRTATTAAALLTMAVAAPAAGATVGAPGRPAGRDDAPSGVRGGSTGSAADRVADFFGAYLDALHDSGRGRLAQDLRRHYLTAGFRHRLVVWERDHGGVDGVLRTRQVPTSWEVAYEDSAMGRVWTRVRLSSGEPGHPVHTYLSVRSDLATRLISDIRPAGQA
ncbi:hypothetical protein RKE29_10785 [Streptomyces sp. B1866]|uniref:hypothetical protein n=1 Tax=Streptomyces sp. B1866 TaxID=3075431 RepID=UPI00288E84E7|nr:hypothetical protein [Streptomyces sp. B1866]MDT3397125.1 hypothetical protein [Streptomyces sp. B1866]